MRWVWRGLVALVLAGLIAVSVVSVLRTNSLREELAEVQSSVPEPYDDDAVQGRVDGLTRDLNNLRELLLFSDVPVDELRRDAQEAIVNVEEEFRYICSQFTTVLCRTFPNGRGLYGR